MSSTLQLCHCVSSTPGRIVSPCLAVRRQAQLLVDGSVVALQRLLLRTFTRLGSVRTFKNTCSKGLTTVDATLPWLVAKKKLCANDVQRLLHLTLGQKLA